MFKLKTLNAWLNVTFFTINYHSCVSYLRLLNIIIHICSLNSVMAIRPIYTYLLEDLDENINIAGNL